MSTNIPLTGNFAVTCEFGRKGSWIAGFHTGIDLYSNNTSNLIYSKGETYNYGIQTKIKVIKNQLPAPFNVTYEGEFVCTDIGIIGASKEDMDEYRKNHVNDILKKLAEISENSGKTEKFDAVDINFVETEDEFVVD